jgi:hypothetical protein
MTLPSLAAEDLLGAGPDETWLAALSPDLARAVRGALAELTVRVVDRPVAVLPKIQAEDAALARKLASDFLDHSPLVDFLIRPAGLEPATCGSVDHHSIQLSYGRKLWRRGKVYHGRRASVQTRLHDDATTP